uniref:Glycoprotein vIgFam5 n=1 Tax=Elephant endotheliotropic herpesvirus 1A TaxID=759753 RepID=A0A866VUI8_ELHV1|nr:glycoprotein vIgFam5 [Elephant endotheliotropic herpesvirus 1A]
MGVGEYGNVRSLWFTVFIHFCTILSSEKIVNEVHVGENITFGFTESLCNFDNITWLHGTVPFINWIKPNVTYSKMKTKTVNVTNPCLLNIYKVERNDSGNYTLEVCNVTISTHCRITFLLNVDESREKDVVGGGNVLVDLHMLGVIMLTKLLI